MNADTKLCGLDPASEYVELAAEVMSILSDPTRIRIILALRVSDELPVNSIDARVSKKPPAD